MLVRPSLTHRLATAILRVGDTGNADEDEGDADQLEGSDAE
jgi:hypothetical protein